MTAPREDAFWRWSLERYERKGAAPLLLEAQDRFGFNVNLALWCCWCAARGFPVPPDALGDALRLTGEWNAKVTKRLRGARRYLKTEAAGADADKKALRRLIKDAELGAEKVEQSRLQDLAETFTGAAPVDADTRALATRSLLAYAALTKDGSEEDRKAGLASLIDSIVDHILPADGDASKEQDQS